MAGKLKEVRERMKSVQSTQQITKAMKMVSAAKLRKSQDAVTKLRPYAKKLREMLSSVAIAVPEEVSLPLLRKPTAINKILILCITSDRGLCGGFNANIVKLTHKHIQEQYPNKQVQIWNMGKKGYEALKKMGYAVDNTYIHLTQHPSSEQIASCIHAIKDLFSKGEVDAVDVIFSEFKNATLQIPTVESMLPFHIQHESKKQPTSSPYIFEQQPLHIMEALIPLSLQTQIRKGLLDSIASEHGARMSTMDKATENANELFKQLKVTYNSARQAAITTEISEIIAGASAL